MKWLFGASIMILLSVSNYLTLLYANELLFVAQLFWNAAIVLIIVTCRIRGTLVASIMALSSIALLPAALVNIIGNDGVNAPLVPKFGGSFPEIASEVAVNLELNAIYVGTALLILAIRLLSIRRESGNTVTVH